MKQLKKIKKMSRFLLFFLLMHLAVHAQRGLGTNAPHKSSILELKSTTKGFLMPRLTTLERTSINNPAEGLLVYCKETKTVFLYADNSWNGINGAAAIPNNEINPDFGDQNIVTTGKVGIGTNDPEKTLHVESLWGSASVLVKGKVDASLHLEANDGATLSLSGSNNNLFKMSSNTVGDVALINESYKSLSFGTDKKRHMIIDMNGEILIGTANDSNGHIKLQYSSLYLPGLIMSYEGTKNSLTAVAFKHKGQNTYAHDVGSIKTNETSTSYTESSDYRLKTDWQPIENALKRLKQLNPVNFEWKVNGTRRDGFIAHQVDEVESNVVIGKKDAVDKDGKPKYQVIDQSKLIPLLTAALQESLVKIENLTKRLEALEAKLKN